MGSRSTRVRKTPQQARSRAMVQRILDAAAHTLVEHGYESASTNRIAAAAGISPGSLYQYFPDKEAVAAAVVERFMRGLGDQVSARVTAALAEPGPVLLRTALEALLDAMDVHPGFLLVVIQHAARRGRVGSLGSFEQRIVDLITAYLTLHRHAVRADLDPDAAAWVLVRVIEQLTTRYVLDRPAISRERFLEETTHVVVGYLRPLSR